VITDPGGLATAAARQERAPRAKVTVDWDNNGVAGIDDVSAQVGTVRVTRQITGDLPDEVTTVEGSSVAEAVVELPIGDATDNAKHAAWYFSRFNPASPLAGKERLARPVTVDVGFDSGAGPVTVRRFTGISSALPVSSTDRTAELTAWDGREMMRSKVDVPAVAADVGPGSIKKPGLNAQWLVDLAFRRCGFNASPNWGAAKTLVSATMHGSAAPDVGRLFRAGWYDPAAGTHERCRFTDGRFGYALDRAVTSGAAVSQYNVVEYELARQVGLPSKTWDLLWGELYLSDIPAGLDLTTPFLLVNMFNGKDPDIITVDLRDVGGVRKIRVAYSRGTSGASYAEYDFTATFYIQFGVQCTDINRVVWARQDFVDPAFVGSSADLALPMDTGLIDRVQINALGVVEGFSLVQENPGSYSYPFSGRAHVAGVDLGRSKNELVAALPSDSRDAWGLVQEIASAEFAWCGFDENMRPFYRTGEFWTGAARQTASETVTSQQKLLALAYDDGIDKVRNQIKVPVKALTVTPLQDVWTADTLFLLARSSTTFFVEFTDPLVELDTTVISGTASAGSSRVRANTKSDGTGTDRSSYIKVTIDSWTSSTAKITVTNNLNARLWIVDTTGASALVLAGRQIMVNDRTTTFAYEADAASIAVFGEQPLDLPENPWRQDLGFAKGVASALKGRLAQPNPTLTGIRVLGNPLRQLGDRVLVQDPEGLVLDEEYWLTGITDELSPDSGYTQALDVRQAWTAGIWGVSRWGDGTSWG
jgi:hypothetical protein